MTIGTMNAHNYVTHILERTGAMEKEVKYDYKITN